MTMDKKDLDGFATAEETLTYLSKALNNKLNRTKASADPASDFMRLDAALRAVHNARVALAAAELQQINNDVAASTMAAEIKAAADEAKIEAERIKKAVKVVNELVAFVDKVTGTVGLVGKILAL